MTRRENLYLKGGEGKYEISMFVKHYTILGRKIAPASLHLLAPTALQPWYLVNVEYGAYLCPPKEVIQSRFRSLSKKRRFCSPPPSLLRSPSHASQSSPKEKEVVNEC